MLEPVVARTLRVFYDHYQTAYPPFQFPCAVRSQFRSPTCPHPGISFEVVELVAGYLNRSVVPVRSNISLASGADLANELLYRADLIGDIWPLATLKHELRHLNATFTASLPTVYTKISVLMSDRPTDESRYLFGIFQPFTWQVWLLFLLIVLGNKLYHVFLTRHSQSLLADIRQFRPSFAGSLFPIALAIVVLTSLYKSGLLTRLVVVRRAYLVHNVADLAALPADVDIYSVESIWRRLLHDRRVPLDDRTRRRLAERPYVSSLFDRAVLERIRAGRAVGVWTSVIGHRARALCGQGVRVLELNVEPIKMGFLLNRQHKRMERELNRAITGVSAGIDDIVGRYERLVALPAERLCRRASPPAEHSRSRIDWGTVRGIFVFFAFGLTAAVIVFVAENISTVSAFRRRQIQEDMCEPKF